jgi:hypothetical protein
MRWSEAATAELGLPPYEWPSWVRRGAVVVVARSATTASRDLPS